MMIAEMIAGVGNTPFYAEDETRVYSNITSAKPELPSNCSEALASLLKGLLTKMVVCRLGNANKGGTKAVQEHEWFSGVDWERLQGYDRGNPTCGVEAPWTPQTALDHDTVLSKFQTSHNAELDSPENNYAGFDSYVAVGEGQHRALTAAELSELTGPLRRFWWVVH